ncbi:glycosyltransferase family 2 protein [Paenibacillus sp. YPG26]|uniref:glycosyltransferase n=1 Tax=Paenibacillus sp. YPG26 TaxID=2878915 RepID=UPI00203F0F19|nr:glycosyltransferase family 2 protein [Paenibacillus sp. YPG26]USB32903.1 glycosyltransferase family 2 protein [Paenibacillus sp. YPG26]
MYYLWLSLTVILSVQLVFVCWNTSQLPRLPLRRSNGALRARFPQNAAKISVLIPARNEEDNLPACLTSVLGCQAGDLELEVIVLDDRSTDATYKLAQAAAERDSRVRVIRGARRPPGWMGKSYACHQLAQEANGIWWLFLDADVRLRPNALQAVMAEADVQGRGLITGFPRQETGTWLEKLAVPMMALVIACHLPIRMVRQSGDPRFVAAHGAFMCIHRDSYAASGGHAGIASSLLDDMMLARRVKEAGDPVLLCGIHEVADMRMYRNAEQVWNGYKKNIYEGVSRNGFLLGSILTGYMLGYVLPAVVLILALFLGWWETAGLAAITTALGMVIKAVSDGRSGRPIWGGALMPASAAVFIAIAAASWRSGNGGKGYIWKGRHYS